MKGAAAALSLLAAIFSGCSRTGISRPKVTVSDAADPAFYTQAVQPIFQSECYRCHGWMNHRGDLNLETREAMLKGGNHGPSLVPGDPEKSLLVRLIRHEGPLENPMPMPNKGAKLPEADIATVERWVKSGAIMPKRDDLF